MKEKTTVKVRFPEVKGENVHKIALICSGELVRSIVDKDGVTRIYKFPRRIFLDDFLRQLRQIQEVEVMGVKEEKIF